MEIISREEALSQNLTTYFTGLPSHSLLIGVWRVQGHGWICLMRTLGYCTCCVSLEKYIRLKIPLND